MADDIAVFGQAPTGKAGECFSEHPAAWMFIFDFCRSFRGAVFPASAERARALSDRMRARLRRRGKQLDDDELFILHGYADFLACSGGIGRVGDCPGDDLGEDYGEPSEAVGF